MGAISKVLPSPARPISVAEFTSALLATWRAAYSYHGSQAHLFGLAVSGGVDSMALVALCSRMQQTPFGTLAHELQAVQPDTLNDILKRIEFRAFVVNHGARQNSELEAEAVSKVLEERGIRTQVLKIDWLGQDRPANLPNFESIARRSRFQVLGKACRGFGIRSLLLAHHEDDQAETVLMRMITGHRMLGLTGIKSSSEIPECYGMHGVHESGGFDTVADDEQHPTTWSSKLTNGHGSSTLPDGYHQLQSNSLTPLQTEFGGINISRPLLGFSKARLIATCQAEQMPWFEDHTNQDPTVTMRNAIRHMYKTYVMPVALTKPALLRLSKNCQEKKVMLLNELNIWLASCSIQYFETRSGTLRIRFVNADLIKNPLNLKLWRESRQIAAMLLSRIIKLITPEEHVSLSSLHGAVERVFPELFWQDRPLPAPTSFTVAGVQFRPSMSLLSEDGPFSINGGMTSLEKCEWLISRQPYSSAFDRPTVVIPTSKQQASEYPWSGWTLYDGRYWVRIQNRGVTSILIRPLRKEDFKGFKESLAEADQTRMRKLLKEIAPGDVRWTLPAVVLRQVDGKEKVLALPTLDISAPDAGALLKWEVRYKKVDMTGLQVAEIPHFTEPPDQLWTRLGISMR